MVKIRLALKGKKKQPYYHVVAIDSAKRRDGRILEKLGFYNPGAEKPADKGAIDRDKYDAWIKKGAQPTETVVQLLKFSSN